MSEDPNFFMLLPINPEVEQKLRKQEADIMEQILKQQQKDNENPQKPCKKSKQKPPKTALTTKLRKKSIQSLLPPAKHQPLSQQQYVSLSQTKDAEQFSLASTTFLGKILKVVDGDTYKIAFRLYGSVTRFNFRLTGLDTPESRTGLVKEFGVYVKELVRRMLEGRLVRVQAQEFDKYGRVLARLYAFSDNQEFCVNDFLVENELAKSYSGKTKVEFTAKDYDNFKSKFIRSSWPEVIDYPRVFFKDTSGKNQ